VAKGMGQGSRIGQITRGGLEAVVKRQEKGAARGGKRVWCRTHFGERAREKRGGGEGERTGGEKGVVTGQQKGTPFSRGPGPSRSGKTLHRAKSCQCTGHRAYTATSEEEGGRGTTSWTWIKFDGRGGGKGLMRHSCPIAEVGPKWARKEGKRQCQLGRSQRGGVGRGGRGEGPRGSAVPGGTPLNTVLQSTVKGGQHQGGVQRVGGGCLC